MRRRRIFLDVFGGATNPAAKRMQPSPIAHYALSWLLAVAGMGVPAMPSAQPEQPVTAADLVGTVMTVSVTNDRIMRRDSRQYPDKYQTDWTIEFVSEDTIRPTFVGTDYAPRRTSKTPVEAGGLISLGRTKETPSRGGGTFGWLFEAGALTFLRTYEAGAMKAVFAVTRTDIGFACTANVSWPKETGKPTIVLRSFVDNGKVEIISAKQAASSCTIGKPTTDDGQRKP